MLTRYLFCFFTVFFWSNFPLHAQGKQKAGPERYESSIAAFEARDRKNPPPAHPLLFVGSSSIRFWDLEKSWPDSGAINNGFGGSTLADSIYFFKRHIAPYHARAIVIYAGDNDIAKGMSPDDVQQDFITLTGLIEKKFPATPVIYISIKPSIARWKLWKSMQEANEKIAAYCAKRKNLHFADIAKVMLATADGKPDPGVFKKDGLHLNEKGYAQWKEVIRPILKSSGVE